MMKRKKNNNKRHATQQSVDQAVKSICDVIRRGNCAGAMQYVPELTWILFLRILDEKESREQQESEALGVPFRPSLEAPYRWRDWAAPPHPEKEGNAASPAAASANDQSIGWKRAALQRSAMGSFFHFVNLELLPHLKALKNLPDATPRQVIRAMVQAIDPKADETVYDPGCGTGGFLAQSFEHVKANLGAGVTAEQLESLKQRTFWGREKENLIYPIALANLVLHGIDKPNIWHGNTLTGQEIYGGLFDGAPSTFDVILTNPPFGGKEDKGAQTNFDFKTGSTQVLFLQHVIRSWHARREHMPQRPRILKTPFTISKP